MKKNHPSAADSNRALPKNGVDSVLAAFGKQLQPGQAVSFQLVKSHKALFQQIDPVNAKNAPPSDFPLIAKFPESVVRPDLTKTPWLTGRFYEQDHQTIIDEDDEDETALQEQKQQRKRRRWGSSKETQRQWVLQEEAEFAETMLARKERKVAPNPQGSSRYEATAEHNPSQYIMLQLVPNSSSNGTPVFEVTVLPTPYAVHTFSQPMARNAMSLTQAEQLLMDQRSQTMTRFMMHQNVNANNGNTNTNGINPHRTVLPFSAAAAARGGNSSKARLLGKLQQQHSKGATPEDDDDDIMADVTFRNRRKGGGSSRARKELITSMADEGVRVDDEGVLGGTNDTEFGGKRHFGRVQVPTGGGPTTDGGNANAAGRAAAGAEGMAMSTDFYQRDVQAEYDELDYDANEQFDDDDVDVGETEVVVDSRGFGGAGDDDDNDPDADDDDDEDEDNKDVSTGGAEGLASLAGFRAMLAKARDRTTSPTNVAGAAGSNEAADANGGAATAASAAADDAKMDGAKGGADDDGNSDDAAMNDASAGGGVAADTAAAPDSKKKKKDAASASPQQEDDDFAQIRAAAEKSALAAKQKASPDGKGGTAALGAGKFTGLEVDDAGQRLVTLEAIRREIWLNHGSIAMKRLMKIFNIKKKSSAERQESFKSLVRELCNMIEDPVSGRKLVLKQHYAHMG